jgi:O-antigen/teichoic acid export membrane protein
VFKGLKFAYLATILDLFSPILLLPFVIVNLNTNELGFWYLMASLNVIVKFPESALIGSITRNCTYYLSKFKEKISNDHIELFKSLIIKKIIEKKINLLIIFSIVLYLIPCVFYIYYVTKDNSYYFTWTIFIISNVILTYGTKYKSISIILGGIEKIYIPEAISKLIYISIGIILLKLHFSLDGLVFAQLISSICYFIMIRRTYIINFLIYQIDNDLNFIEKNYKNLLFIINSHIKKEVIKQIKIEGANTLTARFSILLVGAVFSVQEVAIYGLTSNLFSIIHRLSMLPFTYLAPFFTKLNGLKQNKLVIKLFQKVLIYSLLFAFIASLFVVIFGQYTLHIISENVKIGDTGTLFLFLIITVLSVFYDSFILLLITKKDFIFLTSSIFTSLIIILIQAIYTSHLGINQLLITTIVIPMSYVYWKWPLYTYKKLKLN